MSEGRNRGSETGHTKPNLSQVEAIEARFAKLDLETHFPDMPAKVLKAYEDDQVNVVLVQDF